MKDLVVADREVDDSGQEVGSLELFFDLVFVVVIAQITALLVGDPHWQRMVGALGLLVVTWTSWFSEVASTNVSRGISREHRMFVLAAMAGVAVMAIGIHELDAGRPVVFAVGNAMTRTALAPVWVAQRKSRGHGPGRALMLGPGLAVGWMLTMVVPHGWVYGWWALLVVVEWWLSLFRLPSRLAGDESGQGPVVFDSAHMLERIRCFVMICFGEAVAQLVGSLVSTHTTGQWVVGGFGFVLIALMFWLFYDVTMDRVEHALSGAPERLGDFLGVSQLVIVAGIIGVAAGIAGAVGQVQDGRLTSGGLTLLAGGSGLFLLGITSMSMEALKVLVMTTGKAPWQGHRRSRISLALLGLGLLARAVLLPILLIIFGGHLAPWLVILLVTLTPLSIATSGFLGPLLRRRQR